MVRNASTRLWLLAGIALFGLSRQASAQSPGMGSPASNGLPSGMYANPYANPYLNPFLNPYMTQVPVNGNPALYFFAAQQSTGGIGSGQLSGLHAPRVALPAAAESAVTDNRRATDVPGASAARYFNRKPHMPSTPTQYYNRQKTYSPSSRR